MRRSAAIVGGLMITATLVVALTGAHKETSMLRYVITETGKFTSLDPLEGDSSQNLPVVRMLYATPIEIHADDSLGSRVLESFSYNSVAHTISWKARPDVFFSDGSPITADDIAFAVARMAYARPNFPLIKLIRGLHGWLKKPEPLKSYPEGITVSANSITIELTEDYPHPMFRFCLEIFGIIPKRNVDPATNKITVANGPTSGYYEIAKSTDDSILFQKRPGIQNIQGMKYADKIELLYRNPKTALADSSLLRDDTVILSSEALLSSEELSEAGKTFNIGFTPAAWFTVLQINPEVTPFQDSRCRHVFAETFRQAFESLSGSRSEASVFTKLVSGYKSHGQLAQGASIPAGARTICLRKLSSAKVPFGVGANTPKIFVDSVRAVLCKGISYGLTGIIFGFPAEVIFTVNNIPTVAVPRRFALTVARTKIARIFD